MNNISRFTVALALAALTAFGQSGITTTTLSAATAYCPATLSVASATGIDPQDHLLIDDEDFLVNRVNSTTITVTCGQSGTVPTKHGNGATVYIGLGSQFNNYGGYYQNGSVTRRASFGLFLPKIVPATVSTATAVTLTVGQVQGGFILEDPNGGAATATLPTAALLVAATPGAMVGTSFYFDVRNTADANETLTIAGGSGGTTSGTMTIAQNNGKRFLLRFTNVSPGSETYTVYSLGTYTF